MPTNTILALMAWMLPFQMPLPISSDGVGQGDVQQLLWSLPTPLWHPPAVVLPHYAVFGTLTVAPVMDFASITLHEDASF